MKKSTRATREQLLRLILPVATVLLVYDWTISSSQREELANLRLQTEKARRKAVSAEQVAQRKKLVKKQQREVRELHSRRSRLQPRFDALAGQLGSVRKRTQVIQELTDLLRRHDLKLDAEAPAGKGQDAKLPVPLQQVSKRLSKSAAHQEPQLWRLRLTGKYVDVLAALDELAATESLAVPVNLSMEPAAEHAELRSWTLLVWI